MRNPREEANQYYKYLEKKNMELKIRVEDLLTDNHTLRKNCEKAKKDLVYAEIKRDMFYENLKECQIEKSAILASQLHKELERLIYG